MCEVKSPKLNKELFETDALGRCNPTLSTVEDSQVLDGDSVDEVCLPSSTPVAEAQSACRKQEVHIDLEEDVKVSVSDDVITDETADCAPGSGDGLAGGVLSLRLVMKRLIKKSMTVIVIMLMAWAMFLVSYCGGNDDCGGDDDCGGNDDVPFWLFLAGDEERPAEPKTIRRSTRSTLGVYHDPVRLSSSAVIGLPV